MVELRLCFIGRTNILDYCGKQYANRKTYIIQPIVELRLRFTTGTPHFPPLCIWLPTLL